MATYGGDLIMCFKFGEILLPKEVSVKDWAVVACDQYTSNVKYWEEVKNSISGPSTLNLIFPECYLSADNSARIEKIIEKQREYVDGDLFTEVEGTVLVHRTTNFGNDRWGLMCLVDLDEYSNDKGAKPLIRATEGLVIERIPPRVQIRKNCPLELPHIMVLIDDSERTVIEPLKNSLGKVLYEGELNGGGGNITGYCVSDTTGAQNALNELLKNSVAKYGEKLLFLVGDGNHSLATAKACRDESNPLSKYALVEIVNIYDEGLKFEPIHRAIFCVDNKKFIDGLNAVMAGKNCKTTIYDGANAIETCFPDNSIDGVKLVQEYIDGYLKENGGEVDYIHGSDELVSVCTDKNAVGIALKAIDKSTFFDYIVKNGTLPRKTFSMGEADEKRYYIECRKVK